MRNIISIIAAILFSLLLLSACSSEESEPQPKFDCALIMKEADQAHDAWQNILKSRPVPYAAKYEMEAWQKKETAARAEYETKRKLKSNCQ